MKCLSGRVMILQGEAMSGNYTKDHSFKARTVPNGLERPREAVNTSSPGEEEEVGGSSL